LKTRFEYQPKALSSDEGLRRGVVLVHWVVLPKRAIFTEVKEHDHPENLPEPKVLARRIVENLQSALEEFQCISEDLEEKEGADDRVKPAPISHPPRHLWQASAPPSAPPGRPSPTGRKDARHQTGQPQKRRGGKGDIVSTPSFQK